MSKQQKGKDAEVFALLNENVRLARENNLLLKKMYRNELISIVIRVIWYGILIGMPFALYFYILEPYFNAFGSNYEVFRQGMAEIPGLKGLERFLPSLGK